MVTVYLVLLLVFVSLTHQEDLSRCPGNIQKGTNVRIHGNKCYEFIIHRRHDWDHARSDCVSKGGHLVTIQDIKTENFIMSVLNELYFKGKGVWIGLNDKDYEGRFKWESGSSLNFTFWAPGEPGNIVNILPIHHEEDCVLLKYIDSGHWHDYPCTGIIFLLPENDAWICEYDLTGSSKPALSTKIPTTSGETVLVAESTRRATTLEMEIIGK